VTAPVDPAMLRLGAALWVQDATWPELRDAALAAEDAGFDSLWVDDHLLNDEGDPEAPKLEAWTTLAALAAVTSRARLGLLVGANTLRNPGLVAKMAVTLDEVSGGRLTLGLGSGWMESEHRAFGFDFGASPGERLDRLEESVGLLRRLLAGERVTHEGRFYRFDGAVARPGPHGATIPVLIGGSGRRKTLRLVAEHADLWNCYGEPDEVANASAALDAHCAAVGRDPAAIVRSVTQNVVVRDDRDAALGAFTAYARRHAMQPGEDRPDIAGSPAEVAARLREFAALGVAESYWVFRVPWDRETIRRATEVRALLSD
jgi:F420-dependent oxidoreductase-like protein